MKCQKYSAQSNVIEMDGETIASSLKVIDRLSSEKSDKGYEELTAAFRYLRTICAKDPDVRPEIIQDGNVIRSTLKILSDIVDIEIPNDAAHLCLVVGLQFLANLLVNNHEIQDIIWQSCQHLLKLCLWFDKGKVQNCAAMIMYNIFLGHPEFIPFELNLFEQVVMLTTNESSLEFPVYLLQLYVSKTHYVQDVYDSLKPNSKLIIIEIIQDLIKRDNETLNKELVHFFVRKFLNYSDHILSVLEKTECSFEANETVKILELLSSISSCSEINLKTLQDEKSLLINCVMLLRAVHSLSKESNSTFSMIQKLSELDEIEKNTTIQEHPYFGFKSSLIRLIGNLCWKNTENQTEIRELECIPILLDCCNIDGRNPFIIQWTILAIRNICENNVENQKYIAAMPKTGTIDIAKLEKMGIMLNKESDGSTLSICPLEFKK